MRIADHHETTKIRSRPRWTAREGRDKRDRKCDREHDVLHLPRYSMLDKSEKNGNDYGWIKDSLYLMLWRREGLE